MGSLLLLAPRLERRYTVSTALALAAFLLTACDPFVLWDTGFQLSFLGTLGIVLWMPFFTRLFAFLAHLPLGTYMAEMVAVTLAAQVATLPILALNFNTISFVAPLANLLSVPLLGLFLILGVLICLGGLIALPLALACSWLAWPLLWYLLAVLNWCSHLPGAYLPVSHLNPLLIWGYYLFVGLATLLLAGRPASTVTRAAPAHHLTPRIQQSKRIGLICVALLVILSIALASNITPTTQPLSITLLIEQTVGEGQALFLKTPDGQTALINEGASSTVLADTLDPRLPFWQRSLTLLVLPDTNAANLAGAQDILNRYQLGRVVDGGMLHPSTAYALWRKTLAARDLPYTQMRQGATLRLDKQISLQVLWPPAQLHKSSDEEQDNALVLRLRSPGLNMLFLDVASLSSYALHTLSQSISPSDLQANVVQISETAGKRFPAALATLLSLAHPTLLLIMPTPSRTRQPTVSFPSQQEPTVPAGPWQTVWTPSTNEMEIISTGQGWNFSL
jgi:ComEC/Rec2-related protein